MAKTAAEYQRAYRQRKAAQQAAAGDQIDRFIKGSFSDFISGLDRNDADFSTLEIFAAHSGITYDHPSDDSDVDFASVGVDFGGYEPGDLGRHGNSLAKAERMMATFETGYSLFADLVNRFKRSEIEARIAEIEASDLADPNVRKVALADLVRLNKLLDRLGKEVRFSYPVTEIRG